jgi:hypothetical protein
MAAFRYWDKMEESLRWADFFEVFFLIDFILKFFLEYTPKYRPQPVRNIKLTVQNYLKGTFMIDLMALIPLQKLTLTDRREQIFFLFKGIRVIDLIRMYDSRKASKFIANRIIKVKNWIYNIDESKDPTPLSFTFNV